MIPWKMLGCMIDKKIWENLKQRDDTMRGIQPVEEVVSLWLQLWFAISYLEETPQVISGSLRASNICIFYWLPRVCISCLIVNTDKACFLKKKKKVLSGKILNGQNFSSQVVLAFTGGRGGEEAALLMSVRHRTRKDTGERKGGGQR